MPANHDSDGHSPFTAILEKLESIEAVLLLLGSQALAHRGDDGDYLVTLLECAALVQRKKRTLENYRNHESHPLPEPKIRGEGGKTSWYPWSEMRPWLESVFDRRLPETPPSSQFPFF